MNSWVSSSQSFEQLGYSHVVPPMSTYSNVTNRVVIHDVYISHIDIVIDEEDVFERQVGHAMIRHNHQVCLQYTAKFMSHIVRTRDILGRISPVASDHFQVEQEHYRPRP